MNIALIPARSGSKRLPQKNIKLLKGLPLLAYSIKAAIESEVFSEVIVSTDCPNIALVAERYGASAPILRPLDISTDESTDIEWVNHALNSMVKNPLGLIDFVTILRPTSPLRKSRTIVKALDTLRNNPWADSLRAMEVTFKHPGKMWILDKLNRAHPYLNQSNELIQTFNRPTQTLQKIWIQNASLEIVKLRSILETNSISGKIIMGFEMPGMEGFDINNKNDFEFLEFMLNKAPNLLD